MDCTCCISRFPAPSRHPKALPNGLSFSPRTQTFTHKHSHTNGWRKEETLVLTSFVLHQVQQEVGAIQGSSVPEGMRGPGSTRKIQPYRDTAVCQGYPFFYSGPKGGTFPFPGTFSNCKHSRCLSPPLSTCRESGGFFCVVFAGFVEGVKGCADPAGRRPDFLERRRPFFACQVLLYVEVFLRATDRLTATWGRRSGGGRGGEGRGFDAEADREPPAMLQLLLSKKKKKKKFKFQQSREVRR